MFKLIFYKLLNLVGLVTDDELLKVQIEEAKSVFNDTARSLEETLEIIGSHIDANQRQMQILQDRANRLSTLYERTSKSLENVSSMIN